MRNLNSFYYRRWRKAVFKRDNYKCKLCGDKGKLEAHHIKRWIDCPELRFEVSNGITLCVKCHTCVTGQEEAYEAQLRNLIGQTVDLEFYMRIQRKLDENT